VPGRGSSPAERRPGAYLGAQGLVPVVVVVMLVIVMVAVVTVVIPVIHAAVLALSFNPLSALLHFSSVLSMTINFVLKVLLGPTNALFAIAPCIGQ
jgi:hypothetical protein